MEDIMKKTLLLGFLGLFLLSLISSPGIAQDANEILKKMIDAMGGRKVLESVRDTTLTGTWEMTEMGSGNLTMYQKEPNKIRWDGEIGGVVVTMAYDGAMAWWLNPQAGAREDMPEGAADSFKRGAMGNDILLDPAKFGISFAYKGKEKINNKDYFVLEETYSDGYKATLWIDPETNLLYKAKSKSVGPSGMEVESESVMSDYRKIDGVMTAHSITTIQGGQEYMRMTFTSVKFNTGLEDSLFKKYISLITIVNAGAVETVPAKDLDLVTKQFREYLLKSNATPEQKAQTIKTVSEYVTALGENGAWADIDYKSKQRAAWPTSSHLSRVLQMTIAMQNGSFTDKKQDELKNVIHRAFGYWIKNDFICPNWWPNQIKVPQFITTIALLLGDQLTPEELNYITQTTLPRTKIGMTGQNRVWLAENTLVGALITRNAQQVKEAADVIFSEVIVTTKEGIQPDFSFHQHGAQLQLGNYGLAFAGDIARWSEILRGSTCEMPAEKMDIFRQFLLNGQNWVIWRGKMDISSCGRQLAPGTPAGKGAISIDIFSAMARVDTEHAKEYTAMVNRNKPDFINDLTGNRYFWRSDFMVHRRPDFYASVKMCSLGVIGAESLNSENLSGLYLADGATYIYRTGDEYTDIFPVWNWRQLPGVTCAQADSPMPSFTYSNLTTKFTGGVSDGVNGCAVLDYLRNGVSAKKAWFFAEDQIVCLGAGIQAVETETNPVITTVNQCLLHGPVRISTGKDERTVDNGKLNAEDITWVEHDGIRYSFPQPQKVVLSTGAQTGKWATVLNTVSIPKTKQTKDIFNMAIEHGTNPKNGSYAYIIQPTEKARQQKAEILMNTDQLQAVRFGTDQIQAVFHAPGSLQYAPDKSISVTQPCLLMLDSSTQPNKLIVTEPTQTLTSLSITLNGTAYDVKLPTGNNSRRSQTVKLQ